MGGIPHLTIYCQGQGGNRKSVFVGVPSGVLVNGFKAGELISSNVALSRALLGQCSGAGLGLWEESMSLLLTPLKKRRRVVAIDNVDFTIYCPL